MKRVVYENVEGPDSQHFLKKGLHEHLDDIIEEEEFQALLKKTKKIGVTLCLTVHDIEDQHH